MLSVELQAILATCCFHTIRFFSKLLRKWTTPTAARSKQPCSEPRSAELLRIREVFISLLDELKSETFAGLTPSQNCPVQL